MEKEERRIVFLVKRNFDFYDIEWSIDNFCLASCRPNWVIQSPEFTARGTHATKWILILKSTSTEGGELISLILKRSAFDTGPERMWVNWRVYFSKDDGEIEKIERLHCFNKGSECGESLKTTEYFLNTFKPFESDLFTVRCEIIIYSEDAGKGFEPCSHIGIRQLSEDLLDLFHSGRYHDLKVKINDKIIPAHKVILRSRNNVLNYLIGEVGRNTESDSLGETDEINLLSLNYEAVMKVMEYLYSGDLKHVLSEPSLDIYECASVLDIHELKYAFIPNKLNFRTSLKTEEFKYSWSCSYFLTLCYDGITSPVTTHESYGTTWKICFYPKSEENAAYFAFFADTIGEMKKMDMCLEFALTDGAESCLFSKRSRFSTESLKECGFKKFILQYVESSLTADISSLNLVVRFRLSTGAKNSYTEKHSISYVTEYKETCIPEEGTFHIFSEQMKKAFHSSDLWDVSFVSNGVTYRIHKCIIAQRSSFLSSLLSEIESGDVPVVVNDLGPDIFCMLIRYIYSGSLPRYVGISRMTKLYNAAITFNLPVLKDICSNFLEENSGKEGAYEIDFICECLKLQNRIKIGL